MVAAKIANMKEGRPPANRGDLFKTPPIDGVSQSDAATMLNVSTKSVERAAVVQRDGVPELVEAVEAVERGEVAVSAYCQETNVRRNSAASIDLAWP